MNTVANKTSTSFLSFVEREGIDNKNGLLRAERFDSEFASYELVDNNFVLTKHNGQVLTLSALELFGKCQLPSQLPAGNGRIDSALDGKTSERKTTIERAPTTPKQALMADIRASFTSQAEKIAQTAKNYMAIPASISADLLGDYFKIVDEGNELVIEGLPIDVTTTRQLLAKEKLSEVISKAENCFAGINGVSITVEPNESFTELAIMAQHFNESDKVSVDAKLTSIFGEKSTKWQVIAAFKTAIINVKLPKQA